MCTGSLRLLPHWLEPLGKLSGMLPTRPFMPSLKLATRHVLTTQTLAAARSQGFPPPPELGVQWLAAPRAEWGGGGSLGAAGQSGKWVVLT